MTEEPTTEYLGKVYYRALDVLASLETAPLPMYTKRHILQAIEYILGSEMDEGTQGTDDQE